jgi:hypothetical protein
MAGEAGAVCDQLRAALDQGPDVLRDDFGVFTRGLRGSGLGDRRQVADGEHVVPAGHAELGGDLDVPAPPPGTRQLAGQVSAERRGSEAAEPDVGG